MKTKLTIKRCEEIIFILLSIFLFSCTKVTQWQNLVYDDKRAHEFSGIEELKINKSTVKSLKKYELRGSFHFGYFGLSSDESDWIDGENSKIKYCEIKKFTIGDVEIDDIDGLFYNDTLIGIYSEYPSKLIELFIEKYGNGIGYKKCYNIELKHDGEKVDIIKTFEKRKWHNVDSLIITQYVDNFDSNGVIRKKVPSKNIPSVSCNNSYLLDDYHYHIKDGFIMVDINKFKLYIDEYNSMREMYKDRESEGKKEVLKEL